MNENKRSRDETEEDNLRRNGESFKKQAKLQQAELLSLMSAWKEEDSSRPTQDDEETEDVLPTNMRMPG